MPEAEVAKQPATVTQCVVLLDDPAVALRPCAGRPSLAWQLREFSRFGVTEFLLCGPGACTAAAADLRLPKPAGIIALDSPAGDPHRWRTLCGTRLRERFFLWQAPVVCDANLAMLLQAAKGGAPAYRMVLQDGTGRAEADSFIHLLSRAADAETCPALPILVPGRRVDDLSLPARLNRRALFLDRDGVLNVDHGYVGSRDRFEWIEGALDALRFATAAGWHVFIVTNQSGVARGLYDEDAVRTLLDWIADRARAEAGTVDDARYCPFHPHAPVASYRRPHPWRKPAPGMLLDLMARWSLEPSRTVMIGDQVTDMQAAKAAGVAGHLFPGGNLLAFLRPIFEANP